MSEATEQSEEVIEVNEAVEVEEVLSSEEPVVEGSEDKPQSSSQNSKQRLKRKLRDVTASNDELRSQMDAQNTRFSELETKLESVINPPAARPSRVEYETEEDYEDALFDYRQPRAVPAIAQPVSEPQPQQFSAEVQENWDSQVDIAEDKYDDFQEVVSNKRVPISGTMAEAIASSDTGGEIAYHLGTNLAEAERIANLSPVNQIRAIDKLGNKFTTITTNAPEPITPTKGQDTAVKDVESMSPEEYRDYRRTGGMGN